MWRNRNVSGVCSKGYKLIPVPENKELRDKLADKSLDELTEILKTYKELHNSTDVDTAKERSGPLK